MIKNLTLLLISTCLLNAGAIVGVRYGQLSHSAEFEGVQAGKKTALGAGFLAGYEGENYRVLLSHDAPSFDKPTKFSFNTLSAHLMDEDIQGIKGFLGLAYAKGSYTHSADPALKKQDIDLYGGEVGLILLDERFPRTQMEFGYRYLVPTNLPDQLKMKAMQHIYVGFNFTIY